MNLFTKVTIVIPTLNEAQAIDKVINEILSTGISRHNIIVVDGGSTDGTIDIVKSKRVKIIMQNGYGKADAIKTAIKYIATEYVIFMDGDYTYPASYIPKFITKLEEGYDLVIGIRKPEPGAQSIIFVIGNRILTLFFNLVFKTELNDVLSGMYAIKKETLKEVLFKSKGFGVEVEIVASTISKKGKIAEIPIKYRSRLGKKKLKMWHGLYILLEIMRLAIFYRVKTKYSEEYYNKT